MAGIPRRFIKLRGRKIAVMRSSYRILIVTLLIFASACAPTRGVLQYQATPKPNAEPSVVWPTPPDAARFRYVGELTGEENFQIPAETTRNVFKKIVEWVAGFAFGQEPPIVLQRPQSGIVDAQGRIYVTDISRQAIYVFDEPGGRLHVWEMAGDSLRFGTPIALALGKSDEILVTDAQLGLVVRLNGKGEPVGTFGKGQLQRPTGIARDAVAGRVYVADSQAHDVKVFDDEGSLVATLGKKGEVEGSFNSPTHLAFVNGALYVSDTLNSRIQVLTPQGETKAVFGRRGLFVGDMPRPKGVAVDTNGYIYVVESYYDHLLVFSGQGEFMLPIGGTGSGIGQFYLPAGVWVYNNFIYIADMFNGRVVVLEFLGEKA